MYFSELRLVRPKVGSPESVLPELTSICPTKYNMLMKREFHMIVAMLKKGQGSERSKRSNDHMETIRKLGLKNTSAIVYRRIVVT